MVRVSGVVRGKILTFRNDISGQSFGRWTVSSYAGDASWSCLCECGTERNVPGFSLRSGISKSCGCLAAESASSRLLKHGHARIGNTTPEYRAWAAARERCTNPNKKNWHRYGGRGIRMCDEWMASFEAFLEYIGARPSSVHSLDRYPNNDGNYEPGNVRWATPEQQGRNTSATRFLTIRGETMCLEDAAKKFGKHRKYISRRLDKGWTDEQAVGLHV